MTESQGRRNWCQAAKDITHKEPGARQRNASESITHKEPGARQRNASESIEMQHFQNRNLLIYIYTGIGTSFANPNGMPRAHRIRQEEYPYHVATRTNGKTILLKKWTYKIIIGVLADATKRYDVQIEHFKMMDNHYHMKLTTPSSNIDIVMWFINNQIAKRINKHNGVTGHLWGSRYHATIVQNDVHAERCVHYIYNNGVKAGLCRRASEDERLSTFDFYAKGKKIDFAVTEDSVYIMMGSDRTERQNQFIEMMDTIVNAEEIYAMRVGLRKLFYGSADFIEKMKLKYLVH